MNWKSIIRNTSRYVGAAVIVLGTLYVAHLGVSLWVYLPIEVGLLWLVDKLTDKKEGT